MFNDQKHIRKCISSIFNQTIDNFEIIIVDDASTDKTSEIIRSFNDKRIRYYRNEEKVGIAQSRNRCIRLAAGDILFFTDSDCIVSKDWLEKGRLAFAHQNCIGTEGKTIYVAPGYQPTFSDRVVENHEPGHYMTCNIAYRRIVFENVGCFDTRFNRNSDRDFGLRASKFGKISFNPDMLVVHQRITFTPLQFVRWGRNIENWVLLYKLHKDTSSIGENWKQRDKKSFFLPVVFPERLIGIFFPPLVLVSLTRHRFRTKNDFNLIPFIYIQIIYERLRLWGMCAKQRVLMI